MVLPKPKNTLPPPKTTFVPRPRLPPIPQGFSLKEAQNLVQKPGQEEISLIKDFDGDDEFMQD